MQPDMLAELIVLTVKEALAPVRAELARVEGALGELRALGAIVGALDTQIGTVRERLAGLEARPPVPGPAGQDGKDGADGLGFDDFAASFDGDRTLMLRWARGAVVKAFPLELPIPRYQGAYASSRAYRVGDVVNYDGSAWMCQAPTSARPGDGARGWQLMVKHGRDLRPVAATGS
jgi:hypothetical protein